MARLRAGYRALEADDVVVIAYRPGRGVSVKVNDKLLARVPGHRAVEARLAAWAAQTPVHEKLRNTIARNPC